MSTEGIYSTTASAVDTTVVVRFQTLPLNFHDSRRELDGWAWVSKTQTL